MFQLLKRWAQGEVEPTLKKANSRSREKVRVTSISIYSTLTEHKWTNRKCQEHCNKRRAKSMDIQNSQSSSITGFPVLTCKPLHLKTGNRALGLILLNVCISVANHLSWLKKKNKKSPAFLNGTQVFPAKVWPVYRLIIRSPLFFYMAFPLPMIPELFWPDTCPTRLFQVHSNAGSFQPSFGGTGLEIRPRTPAFGGTEWTVQCVFECNLQ